MNPDMDGYDEHFNPYYGTCPKHGAWKGSTDECPQCMKEEYENDIGNTVTSICWGCNNCRDEPGRKVDCGYYGFPQRPRVKRCKGFDKLQPEHDNFGYEIN
jgi:hypothetical protein